MAPSPRITCDFCEHRCSLADGQHGICGIRVRKGDAIYTENYGEHVSLAVDPIEKKPLYHMFPGASVLSSALYGCNFRCSFCQNCSISQPELYRHLQTRYIAPDELARNLTDGGYPVAAFTYSEPTVWQDYMLDAARAIRAVGGRTAMITNGFFTEAALERMHPLIDAFNIDLKGDEAFYRSLCGGHVEPILRNIRTLAGDAAALLEVTTMVMEGEHSEDGIMELAGLLDDAGVKVWHLSAFRPAYKMTDHAPTRPEFLDRLYERITAETGIPHVYAYSRRHASYQQTFCANCGGLCIDRRRFALAENRLHDGTCPACGTPMYGVFSG
ncbi:MAG: AmmeMemoRadiSam system radical SAM enzyme [Spirochaeta sp.]|jgi:pyruvate formate lyase activating enzyme|nr:AmmeMemoRadiSam system radical SAM enzyme [Spirochaeta sp.]